MPTFPFFDGFPRLPNPFRPSIPIISSTAMRRQFGTPFSTTKSDLSEQGFEQGFPLGLDHPRHTTLHNRHAGSSDYNHKARLPRKSETAPSTHDLQWDETFLFHIILPSSCTPAIVPGKPNVQNKNAQRLSATKHERLTAQTTHCNSSRSRGR